MPREGSEAFPIGRRPTGSATRAATRADRLAVAALEIRAADAPLDRWCIRRGHDMCPMFVVVPVGWSPGARWGWNTTPTAKTRAAIPRTWLARRPHGPVFSTRTTPANAIIAARFNETEGDEEGHQGPAAGEAGPAVVEADAEVPGASSVRAEPQEEAQRRPASGEAPVLDGRELVDAAGGKDARSQRRRRGRVPPMLRSASQARPYAGSAAKAQTAR